MMPSYTQMSAKSKEIALTEFSDSKYFEKIYDCYHELAQKGHEK